MKDTLLDISAGDRGVLGTKVSSKERKFCEQENALENDEKSSKNFRAWESPTRILKEAFGNLNTSSNLKYELEDEDFKRLSISATFGSHHKKSSVSPPSAEYEQKQTFKRKSNKVTNFLSEKSNKTLKTHFKEPKIKKYKRISILSSSSECDEETPQPIARNKSAILSNSSSSNSEETIQSGVKEVATKKMKTTRKAAAFQEAKEPELVFIEKVYRYEGVYWECNGVKPMLFNCFECSKNSITGDVIEHFKRRHSVLISDF